MRESPFDVLGVSPHVTAQQLHLAWRTLAKQHHPDVGGDNTQMTRINNALQEALLLVDVDEVSQSTSCDSGARGPIRPNHTDRSRRVQHDVSSFTFSVLPVESFELLEIVAATAGAIVEAECPYMIEFTMENLGEKYTASHWCRCEMVPEAGGTMVHLTVGGPHGCAPADIEAVRDELIRSINSLEDVHPCERQL